MADLTPELDPSRGPRQLQFAWAASAPEQAPSDAGRVQPKGKTAGTPGEGVVLTRRGRRRRFERSPAFRPEQSRAGRLELRQRDLSMIAACAKLRFISTHQACMLFGCGCRRKFEGNRTSRPAPVIEHRPGCACTCGVESRTLDHAPSCPALFKDDQQIAARLRELYQTGGYLDRPVVQLQLRVRDGVVHAGSTSMVYSVTKAGIALLSEEQRAGLNRGKLSWVTKNDGGRIFMEHTLRTGDVHVGLTVGLRDRPDLVRLSDADLMSGLDPVRRKQQHPFAVRAKHKGKKLTAVCDLAFGLAEPASGRRRLVLTEIDMGQMPVVRKGATQTSLIRKMVAYATAYDQRLIEKQLGFANVVILMLTTSEKRVQSCVEACQAAFGTSNVARIFLFGTHSATADLLNTEFIDGRGRRVRLM